MTRYLLVLTLLEIGSHVANAYEYRLQFTPQGGAYGLVVAGFKFQGNLVEGDCSYYTESSGSGRDPRGTITYHYNTCTWDLYGNQVSMKPVSSAPVTPPQISQNGTEIIYAVSGTSSTGRDTRGFGFVNSRASQYSWQTPNGGYADIPYARQTITATILSDGDLPLDYDGATVAVSGPGYYSTSGTATVSGTTCGGSVAPGATCSVTVIYDPTTIKCTSSPYGFAYARIDLRLVTDAGVTTDFTEGFTVSGVPACDD